MHVSFMVPAGTEDPGKILSPYADSIKIAIYNYCICIALPNINKATLTKKLNTYKDE